MDRSLVSSLPHPIANALQAFLDEDLEKVSALAKDAIIRGVEKAASLPKPPRTP